MMRCPTCDAELRVSMSNSLDPLRCDRCGTDVVFKDRRRKPDVGIHPFLARRYHETSVDGDNIAHIKILAESEQSGHDEDGATPQGAPEPVPQIPEYDVYECIGNGAMGRVYRAWHPRSEREVAIKVLSKELLSRRDLVARFEREAVALRAFRHPNIVAILDSGSLPGVHYFCMEYVQGTTLRKILKTGPLGPRRAIQIVRCILQGLAVAHSRGIIHRDLKPENVLIANSANAVMPPGERVVVVDFGLAGIVNEAVNPHPNLTRSRVTMGTVNYMAPEQHTDAKRVDHRTDLYACGVILYECLLGDLPLGRFSLPHEAGLAVSRSLDTCLMKALARDPDERYQSASEFDSALASLEDEPPEPETLDNIVPLYEEKKEPPVPTLSSLLKRQPLLIGVLALIAGLIFGILMTRDDAEEVVVAQGEVLPVYASPTEISLGDALTDQWRSSSPAWANRDGQLAYLFSQGKAHHFRRDMSLLTSSATIGPGIAKWDAQVRIDMSSQSKAVRKGAFLAETLLGVSPGTAGAGVYLVSSDQNHAVGMTVYADGTCGIVELKKTKKWFEVLTQHSAVCKKPDAKRLVPLGIDCGEEPGVCRGWVDGRIVASAVIEYVPDTSWQKALGCRNTNCFFRLNN